MRISVFVICNGLKLYTAVRTFLKANVSNLPFSLPVFISIYTTIFFLFLKIFIQPHRHPGGSHLLPPHPLRDTGHTHTHGPTGPLGSPLPTAMQRPWRIPPFFNLIAITPLEPYICLLTNWFSYQAITNYLFPL